MERNQFIEAIVICALLSVNATVSPTTSNRSLRLNEDGRQRSRMKMANEMLVPRYSTTALMCEPVFTGNSGSAKWFHDGVVVANVTSTSNAVLHNRIYRSEQPVPDVGFLIITNISLDDEGEYWCRRDENGQEGDAVKIVIAYVDQFPHDSRPLFYPSRPSIGERVVAECPHTRAIPSPSITWFLNGETVDLSSRRVDVTSNGTLKISQFLIQDIGLYECMLSNFAGRTTAKVFVDAKRLKDGRFREVTDISIFTNACRGLFQNGILWFLIGCLATSCVVLFYLLCAMLFLRPGARNRITLQPTLFLRWKFIF
uniref:Ig-like domain-containing protein n=1 Tax=Parascaris univalens TaxID=6257 RepID=A0A914ZMB5_PARUN